MATKKIPFDTFWKAYPLRKGRLEAERAWNRLSEKDKKDALADIPAYIAECQQKGISFKYPQGWLNGHRWTDEHDEPAPLAAAQPKAPVRPKVLSSGSPARNGEEPDLFAPMPDEQTVLAEVRERLSQPLSARVIIGSEARIIANICRTLKGSLSEEDYMRWAQSLLTCKRDGKVLVVTYTGPFYRGKIARQYEAFLTVLKAVRESGLGIEDIRAEYNGRTI